MATGCSCLDMISNFLFSLEMKPQIVGHILGYYVHIRQFFFPEPQSLVNDLIRITFCKPKTMGCFVLSSTDNMVSLTQIHQGIRCQGALSLEEDTWIQDIYSASEEVHWGQEDSPTHYILLHKITSESLKTSVKTDYLSCVICWKTGIKVPRSQCFEEISPSRQSPILWFQHHSWME